MQNLSGRQCDLEPLILTHFKPTRIHNYTLQTLSIACSDACSAQLSAPRNSVDAALEHIELVRQLATPPNLLN
jgi:hypothetical protein